MKLWRRIAIVAVGFIEALFFSGSLFGWPSLMYVLQNESIYSHLCSSTMDPNSSSQLRSSSNNDVLAGDSYGIETATSNYFISEGKTERLTMLYSEKEITTDEASWNSSESQSGKNMHNAPLVNDHSAMEDLNIATHTSNEQERIVNGNFLHCTTITANEMTKIYTVAAVAYGVTSILIGFSLDFLGLWATRLLGSTMTTAGFLCLTFVSKETPWLLWPALNLIALGTNQLRLSCFQFANLWPDHKTTIIIAYSSAYSISTALFLLVQYAYEANIAFKTIGWTLTALSLFTFPITFLMPRFRIENHKEQRSPEQRPPEGIPIKEEQAVMLKSGKDFDEIETEKKIYRATTVDEIPLKASLFTLSACLHILWHFINFFLVLFYSATFFQWAVKATHSTSKVAGYNQISGLCAVIAPIFIPIAGFITDWQIRRASQIEDGVERLMLTMQAPAYTMAAATTFLIATMICKMFLTEAAIYASIVLISISRPFVVGSCTSYIRIRFHPSHFNRLNGIFTTVVSLLTLVQSPIVSWMFSSDKSFLQAHWILLSVLIISLSSPFHMFIKPLARKYVKSYLKYPTDDVY